MFCIKVLRGFLENNNVKFFGQIYFLNKKVAEIHSWKCFLENLSAKQSLIFTSWVWIPIFQHFFIKFKIPSKSVPPHQESVTLLTAHVSECRNRIKNPNHKNPSPRVHSCFRLYIHTHFWNPNHSPDANQGKMSKRGMNFRRICMDCSSFWFILVQFFI